MAIAPRCAVSNTSSGTSTSPGLTGWTNCGLGFAGTAPAAGDLVFAVGWVAAASQTVSQTGGTGTWTFQDTGSNNTGNVLTTFCAYRVWTGGETAPTFSWSSSVGFGTILMAVAPDAGQVISADVWATNKIDTVAATTHTANAATATGTGELSLILAAGVSSANGTSPMTSSSPASYSEPSGAGTSTTGTAGTPGYRVDAWYRQSLSGTVTPGAATIEGGASSVGTTYANLYHALVAEAQPVRPVARPVYAPGWHPGRALPGVPGGTPFYVLAGTGAAVAAEVDASVTGVAAQVTVASPAGTAAAGANITGVAAPVTVAAPAGVAAGGGAAGATVRSASTYASAATEASFSMPLPSGFAAGDVCWLFVEDRAATGSLGAAPSGWATVAATFHSGSSTSSEMAVYRKVMAGGEGNPTVTGSNGRFSAVCVAVQGADNTTPEDVATVEDGNGASSSTTITSPGVTPAGTNDLLLIGFGCGTPAAGTAINYSTPAAMTLVSSIATTVAAVTESGMMVASLALVSNAATGTNATTITPSAVNGQTVTIGVRAAGTGGDANITGAAAAVTVAAPAGALDGDQNLTGTAAPVTVASPAGTPAGSGNTPGAAAAVTVAGGAGVASAGGAVNVTGAAAPVTVASPAGTPATAANITGVAAPVTVAAAAGAAAGAAPVTGAAAPVTGAAAAGAVTAAANVTGMAAPVTVASPAGVPSSAVNITGVAAPVTVASPAGTPFGSSPNASISGVAAAVTVAAAGGVPHAGAALTGASAPVTVTGGQGTASAPAAVTGVAAHITATSPGGTLASAGNVTGAGAPVLASVSAGSLAAAAATAGHAALITVTAAAGVPFGALPFTIGALTAADTAGSTLTAAGASNTLTGSTGPLAGITAATAPLSVLTAADAPGAALAAGLLDQAAAPVTDESGAFILLEDGS